MSFLKVRGEKIITNKNKLIIDKKTGVAKRLKFGTLNNTLLVINKKEKMAKKFLYITIYFF